jgi:ABC-type oligopeptide transport system substrate-binding subunit
MAVFAVCLLVLTCTVYAAPSATQKSTQQAKPAGGTASNLLNPNVTTQGTITITASRKGKVNASTWLTGS